MILQKIPVSDLQADQIFLCEQGQMYRHLRKQYASLIRLPDGSEPATETVHHFRLDQSVELVPRRCDSKPIRSKHLPIAQAGWHSNRH
jgi:hypothetical protein